MPTILSFLSGRQITNDSGVPQTGAKVYHYRAGTTTALTVWQDSGASVAHAQPVVCDAGGFVPLVYVDDTFNWKIVVTTAADVILPQYNFDNLEKAETDASGGGFALLLLEWSQVTAAGSPVALVPGDAGTGYEGDTTAGDITFNLPSAASVGNGKGFCFKKTGGSNSLILASFGAELIEGSTSDYTIGFFNQSVYIISNGASWLAFAIVGDPILAARLPQALDTAIGALEIAIQSEMETGTDVARAVVPGRQHFHPGHPKVWGYATVSAGVPTLQTSYNVTSITDNGSGDITFTIATDFSTANWCCVATCDNAGATEQYAVVVSRAAGSVTLQAITDTGADTTDPDAWNVMGLGDQ